MFTIERETALSVAEAWSRVTDWTAHADGVPLTRIVAATPGPAGPGTRFTARTGGRLLGFDDPMEVVAWEPPGPGRQEGRCRLEKRGRVMLGWAEIEVSPVNPRPDGRGSRAAARSRVVWREHVNLAGLSWLPDPVVAAVARPVFTRALARLLRVRPAGPEDGG